MMRISIRNIPVAILMASAMTLTACGGGGGGGGGSSDGGGSSGDSLAITSANGRQVAGASFDAFSSSTGGHRAAAVGATAAEIEGSSEPSTGLAQLLHGEILRALTLDAEQGNTPTGAIVTFSIDCGVAGTVTFEFDDANNNELIDIGELFTLTYNSCDFGASFSETFNGTFSLVFNSATPSLDGIGSTTTDWSYSATLTFTNFSITDKTTGETETLDSEMTFSADFDSTPTPTETTVTLVGSFEVTNPDETVAISNYRYSTVLIGSGGLYRDATLEGRATLSSLGGDVIVSTPVPLDNESSLFIWPEFGTLRSEATDGSGFVELDANTGDEETVTVTIDDGSTTTSEIVNWEDL